MVANYIMDTIVKEKLEKILDAIYERAMEIAATEADQEYIMNDIERLAIRAKKILLEE